MTVTRSAHAAEPPASDARYAYEDGLHRWGRGGMSTRRRWISAVLVLVAVALLAAGVAVMASPGEDPGTPLGASGQLDGGLARIHGVIPLESDGWLPEQPPAVLLEGAPEGWHRVRIVLEVVALGADGIDFSAADYSIDGLGSGTPLLVWADPSTKLLRQGETVSATLVFEIPNESVALTIEGADGVRLALGTGHHTPGR